MRRRLTIVAAVAAMLALLTGCFGAGIGKQYANSTSDSYSCVYDGSDNGGEKLKFQVPPGTPAKSTDDDDIIVKIPTSSRFWYASMDDNKRDPLAPKYFASFAQNNVRVQVQGQLQFRFNLSKACEWYTNHGKRNLNGHDELGFNVRGGDARTWGWFLFLSGYFNGSEEAIIKPALRQYSWQALNYDYPVNANQDTGIVPAGKEPGENISQVLGRDIGAAVNKDLNNVLGDNYFCGIAKSETGSATDCPSMTFKIDSITPVDQKLVTDRESYESTRSQLENAQAEGDLLTAQQQTADKAEAAKQNLLRQQILTAELQAKLDSIKATSGPNAKCIAYAKVGLDCNGNALPVPGGITINK